MIGLLSKRGSYAMDTLVAASKGQFRAVDLSGSGLPAYTCPYGLPSIGEGDTVIVVSGFLEDLAEVGEACRLRALAWLATRFRRIVGLDQHDAFRLDLQDAEMSAMASVIKVNGVYKDSSLYAFHVGAETPAGRWTERTHPRGEAVSPENLRKLHLGLPCFASVVPAVRQRVRRHYVRNHGTRVLRDIGDLLLEATVRARGARRSPRQTVHFQGALTHPQRAQAVRLLRASSLPWRGGITATPRGLPGFDSIDHEALVAGLKAEGLLIPPANRLRYRLGMLDCKVVLSITGIGELCFRMAEAWASRRVLVCQDLGHVTTRFPFRPGENVVFCRPDLSDLIDILDDIECNFGRYAHIGDQGFLDWQRWADDIDHVVAEAFASLRDGRP